MNYQLMEFFSRTMDLTDKRTVQECTRIVEQESNPINEAEQNTVILSLTSKLYKMIVDKADDIDFGQIPNTNGDVTKLKEYPQLNECLATLHDILKEYKQDTTPVDNITKALRNIELHRPIFTRGYIMNVEIIQLTYCEMVLAVVNSLSYMISATIEYVKMPNDDGFQIAIDKAGIARTKDSLVYHALSKFNDAVAKDQINKAFEPLVRVRSKGIVGADDMAMVFGIGVLIAIAVNILPILRELTYFFYDVRTRISQYFDLQADLLEMNAADIEKNNSVTVGDRNKVISRQRKIAEFFRKISNTFAIEQKEREVNAAKEIERQNKKMKYDDIEDKTRGSGTVPNGKQTTPTTSDSIF